MSGGRPIAVTLATPRLLLRGWTEQDRVPFAALNADPEVMEHFPSTLTRAESDALADRIEARMLEQGYGLWAIEERASGRFLGFTGLNPVPAGIPTYGEGPALEVGWRLARSAWGHGYATEAATEALRYALGTLGLPRVWSFTAITNVRSQAVMRRLGMRCVAEYDHPTLEPTSPLSRHVLYVVEAPELAGGLDAGV